MLQIPKELNDLSSDWLAHVLDAPVTGFTVVDANAGTTGRAMLELDYADSGGPAASAVCETAADG